MPRVAVILVFSVIATVLMPSVSAQVAEPEAEASARKIDEFGRIGHCDLGARLDNLANQVHDTPGAEAYIISYAPPVAGPALLEQIKDYRQEKSVRAFLVVRLERPTQDDEAATVEDEPTEPFEEIDLTKLVEKWRLELANTHKIGADRFIVLFTTTREFEPNRLSLWIVPKRHPLPDPNEEDKEPHLMSAP